MEIKMTAVVISPLMENKYKEGQFVAKANELKGKGDIFDLRFNQDDKDIMEDCVIGVRGDLTIKKSGNFVNLNIEVKEYKKLGQLKFKEW